MGREAVVVARTLVETWVVEFQRRSRPGTGETVIQTTRSWFDAERGLPVKWEETLHGERDTLLIKGSDDANYQRHCDAKRTRRLQPALRRLQCLRAQVQPPPEARGVTRDPRTPDSWAGGSPVR